MALFQAVNELRKTYGVIPISHHINPKKHRLDKWFVYNTQGKVDLKASLQQVSAALEQDPTLQARLLAICDQLSAGDNEAVQSLFVESASIVFRADTSLVSRLVAKGVIEPMQVEDPYS